MVYEKTLMYAKVRCCFMLNIFFKIFICRCTKNEILLFAVDEVIASFAVGLQNGIDHMVK